MVDWVEDEMNRAKKADQVSLLQLRETEREAHDVRGHGAIPENGIAVVVRDTVRLEELNLTEKALRLPPDRLSAGILRCIRAAEADFARAQEQLLLSALGRTPDVQTAISELRDQFPDPHEDDDDAWGKTSQPVSSYDDDDDDGWNQPILRS
ncbi:hypothetical protein [Segniliparus rugosus]|uniref:hypothetical protein n=1 Tax=Segniliparus rugosus TaxID=286804 RepID=UPI0012EBB039|nr:hypothetical protein [Segniliparus rugosus]